MDVETRQVAAVLEDDVVRYQRVKKKGMYTGHLISSSVKNVAKSKRGDAAD